MALDIENWSAGEMAALSHIQRADWLERQLADLAKARVDYMDMYARTFLGTVGTDRVREQAAKLAASEWHLAAEKIAAQVRAFQFLFGDSSTEDS